jgi:hypothetical protein
LTWARTHWVAIAIAAVLFLIGIGIGASSSSSTTETTTVTTTKVTTTEATVLQTVTEKPPAPAGTIEGDGTFLVGKDIRAGLYHAPASTTGNCYWARLHDLDNGDNSIIDNNNSSGPVLLKVARTDFARPEGGEEESSRAIAILRTANNSASTCAAIQPAQVSVQGAARTMARKEVATEP